MERVSVGERAFKICMVSPFPPRKGGVAVQTALLVHYLEENGIEVMRVDTNLQRLRGAYLTPLRLAVQPWVVLFGLLRKVPRCDVAHFQVASYWGYMPAVLGVPVARLFGKRSVISYQGGGGVEFMGRFPWLVKTPMRLASEVTVCSRELQKAFKQGGIRAELVNNLFDSSLFKFRERTRIKPKMVWTRSMEEMYDPFSAVRTFELVKARYPDAALVMTSDGPLTRSVREYINEHGLTGVTLTGRIPTEDVARAMHEGDVCLNTSKVDGLPTALLEAAASGLPIVTTRAGGIPSVFEDGVSAALVDVGDYRAMAEAVGDLLENPDRARKMGIAASEVVAEYTWPVTSKKLMRMYGK
ncbi:MAG: glycosyltransferase family 4 protein [Candidatus Eisenbacteria bacterium]|nr:glycosyltransferase family 4 protein [Candidatus Eisenbacteria bacterium]